MIIPNSRQAEGRLAWPRSGRIDSRTRHQHSFGPEGNGLPRPRVQFVPGACALIRPPRRISLNCLEGGTRREVSLLDSTAALR